MTAERKGVRVAFDSIGGENIPKLISTLAFQGLAYIYGALAEGDTTIPVPHRPFTISRKTS